MGYSHHWARLATYEFQVMAALGLDFRKLIGPLGEQGIMLVDSFESSAPPWLSLELICFNGRGPAGNEDFCFPRELGWRDLDRKKPDKNGRYFQHCKTAWKPYDLAVTAFLIIAKHHLGQGVKVTSNGTEEEWLPARALCQKVLAYGRDFKLDSESDGAGTPGEAGSLPR